MVDVLGLLLGFVGLLLGICVVFSVVFSSFFPILLGVSVSPGVSLQANVLNRNIALLAFSPRDLSRCGAERSSEELRWVPERP